MRFLLKKVHYTNRTCALTLVSLDYNVDGMVASKINYDAEEAEYHEE